MVSIKYQEFLYNLMAPYNRLVNDLIRYLCTDTRTGTTTLPSKDIAGLVKHNIPPERLQDYAAERSRMAPVIYDFAEMAACNPPWRLWPTRCWYKWTRFYYSILCGLCRTSALKEAEKKYSLPHLYGLPMYRHYYLHWERANALYLLAAGTPLEEIR